MMKSGERRAALALVLLLALCCSPVRAAINPTLEIYEYTLSEVPAVPGDTVTLTLKIHDVEWATCADHVTVQIIASYPLSVSGMDTKYLETVCESDPFGTAASFDIPVDSLAQSGTYPVTIVTNYEKQFDKFSATNTFNVRVAGTPSLTASVESSNPTDIYPGDTASVTVSFQNNGTGRIASSTATFYASDGIEVKWAGREQELGEIPARSGASATFEIEAMKNITPGTYRLTAVLDYIGENNVTGSESFDFDIPIKEKAEFTATASPGTLLHPDEDVQVTVNVKNTGSQEARKIKVRIQPVFPFSTDGTVRYVDSLKPGEEAGLVYLIHVDNDATAGQQVAGLLFDFEDPQGRKFTDSQDFTLDVETTTLVEQVIQYWYVFAAIALLAGIYVLVKAAGYVSRKLKESGKED